MNPRLPLSLVALTFATSPRSQAQADETVLKYVELLGVNSAEGKKARGVLTDDPTAAPRLLPKLDSRGELLLAMRRGRKLAAPFAASWLDNEYARFLGLLGADRASVDFLEEVVAERDRSGRVATDLLLRVGRIHAGRGDSKRARELADRVLAIRGDEPSGDADVREELSQAHAIRGRVYLDRGLWSQAEEEFLKQREFESGTKDLGFGILSLADLEISCGRPTSAIELLEGSVLLADSEGKPHRNRAMAEFYLGIAWLQLARGDAGYAATARGLLRPLLGKGLPTGIRLRTALYLAELSELVGATDETKRYLDQANAIRKGASTLPTNYAADFLARKSDLAIDAGQADRIAALRRETEQLLDRLRDDWDATPPTSSGEGFMAYRHRRRLLHTYFELTLHDAVDDAKLGDCWDELLACQLLSTRARLAPGGVQAVDWDAIRRGPLTADGGGVLFFVVSRNTSHVFGLDREGPFHARLPGFRQLIQARSRLEGVLDTGGRAVAPENRRSRGAETLKLAGEFADDVLPAEIRERLLRWRSVTVCDYGLLRRVPFAALPIETNSGTRLLGEVLAISHTNCLQIEHARRDADLPVGPARVVLGAHDVGREELQGWTAPHGDRAAIVGSLDENPKAAFTHVVAHGVELDRPELFQALRIGPPNSKTKYGFSELVDHELGGLVILSVCGGARAPFRTGDGGFHASLGGALLLSGSHTVLQSPAEILFEPHRDLLTVFHRALHDGATIRNALRVARQEWAAKDADWFLRFEHAQLQIAGAGHLRPFGPREDR